MKVLRHYQREAHKAIFRTWMEHRSALIHVATGGGKSLIAASIIATVLKNGKRALFLADSDDLCYQPLKVIGDTCGVYPSLEKAEHKASLVAEVVVASMQTLSKRARLEKFPPNHFDYILTDEAHRGAKAKHKIHEYFPKAFIGGLTATPYTASLRDLSKFYDAVAIRLPMINLVAQGFAPPISVLTLPVEIDLNAVKMTIGAEGQDYNADDLETCIAPYYQKIVDLIKEHAWDRKIIAFLPLIRSSEAFAAILRNNHIKARHVDGKTQDRQLIYRDLQEGRLDVICNSQVMSTGVDVPEADCFLNLRVTRSPAFYQQGLGRVCRPWPGCIDDLPEEHQSEERRSRIARSPKPDTLILDLLWQHETLNVVRPADMFAASPEDAKRMFERTKDSRTPLELLELAKEMQREKELGLVDKLKQAADKHHGREMRAEHVGVYLDDMALMEYEPVARWEMKKPSPEQLHVLARLGVEIGSVVTKGQASAILSACIKRQKAGLCTLKQVKVLRSYGVDNPKDLTFERASIMIDEVMRTKPVDRAAGCGNTPVMSNTKHNEANSRPLVERGFTRNEQGRIIRA